VGGGRAGSGAQLTGGDPGDHLDDLGERLLQGVGEAVAVGDSAATLTRTIGGTAP
jgi:hypothetical protein